MWLGNEEGVECLVAVLLISLCTAEAAKGILMNHDT